ncbi:ADP-ribosylation factor family-domain-containing protein [Mortierella sp. GBAus27b]|nr:hypothetical protein BGX31_008628 [Mortierella sp. GBA43]KAI8349327.1 ADP-ribosylation factor family-domain-containing protein [Mortierella sp. GBAus27b]
MLGPSNAGKTTILYRLKDNKLTLPSTTFYTNTETFLINGIMFEMWDITHLLNVRAMRPRSLWAEYIQHSHALVYVVDSVEFEPSVQEEARSNLWALLNHEELRYHAPRMPLLMFANKQDDDHAMLVSEVRDMLDLGLIPSEQPWHIQGVSAVTGQGLKEGMEWLTAQLGVDK